MNLLGNQIPIGIETCVANEWRLLILDGNDWYGLGVGLSTTVLSDGYPRTVKHSGDQTGSRTRRRRPR